MGEWLYRSMYSDLSTSWRRVVSFTYLLLYPRIYTSQYSLDRRLDGPQSWHGHQREKKNLLPPTEIKP
jgi:hypothetical protein